MFSTVAAQVCIPTRSLGFQGDPFKKEKQAAASFLFIIKQNSFFRQKKESLPSMELNACLRVVIRVVIWGFLFYF